MESGLIVAIIIIALACAILEIPEKFQKLLYWLCAVLVIVFIASLLGFNFVGNSRIN